MFMTVFFTWFLLFGLFTEGKYYERVASIPQGTEAVIKGTNKMDTIHEIYYQLGDTLVPYKSVEKR